MTDMAKDSLRMLVLLADNLREDERDANHSWDTYTVSLAALLAIPAVSWADDDGQRKCPPIPSGSQRLALTSMRTVFGRSPRQKRLIDKVKDGKATLADLQAGGSTQVGPADTCVFTDYEPDFPVSGTGPGIFPSACLTWFQAVQARALSDKRLLTNEEWQRAAAGPADPGSNMGLADTRCNTDGGKPRMTSLADATPGGVTSCISNWGAHDVVGNLWEWVNDWLNRANQTPCANWTTSAAIPGDDISCVGSGSTLAARLPGADPRRYHGPPGTSAGVLAWSAPPPRRPPPTSDSAAGASPGSEVAEGGRRNAVPRGGFVRRGDLQEDILPARLRPEHQREGQARLLAPGGAVAWYPREIPDGRQARSGVPQTLWRCFSHLTPTEALDETHSRRHSRSAPRSMSGPTGHCRCRHRLERSRPGRHPHSRHPAPRRGAQPGHPAHGHV
jgi:hypothetical protein